MKKTEKITFEELMQYDVMYDMFCHAVEEFHYHYMCDGWGGLCVYGEDIIEYICGSVDEGVEIPWKTYEEFLEEDEDVRNKWMGENCPGTLFFETRKAARLYALESYNTSYIKEYEFYAKSDIKDFWSLMFGFGFFEVSNWWNTWNYSYSNFYSNDLHSNDNTKLKKIHIQSKDLNTRKIHDIVKMWIDENMDDSYIQVCDILSQCDNHYETIYKYLKENNLLVIS